VIERSHRCCGKAQNVAASKLPVKELGRLEPRPTAKQNTKKKNKPMRHAPELTRSRAHPRQLRQRTALSVDPVGRTTSKKQSASAQQSSRSAARLSACAVIAD
jgi:hypothetical protein